MLISLIAWVYISIICLIWGQMFLSAIVRAPDRMPLLFNTSLVCLAGLSVIGTAALGLSLFMPLDWRAHCILLIPPIAYCAKAVNRQTIRIKLTDWVGGFSPMAYCLLAVCILMALIISAHNIVHPDTLNYHARSILLFERYRAIPGIANLKNELGFQCSWFASLALFKLDSPASYNIIFLNGAVLCWYFIFVVQKISTSFSFNPANPHGPTIPASPASQNRWAWLLLLSYTLFSWTQVRLTAASASPDFIVSLYCWAAIYLFIQAGNSTQPQPLYLSGVVLFCLAAILTKLSAIPLLLLAALALAGSFRFRPAKFMIAYSCVALIILLAKNRIASGYLLYPLSMPDIFNPAWKMKLSTVNNFRHYISTYARFPIDDTRLEIYCQVPCKYWVPRWWERTAFPDRLLLLGLLLALVLHLVFTIISLIKRKPVPAWTGKKYQVALLIALGGSLLWFLGAPSPRFGTGFLIPLVFLLYRSLPPPGRNLFPLGQSILLSGRNFFLATGCLVVIVAGYNAYRCFYFFIPSELIYPTGIMTSAYHPLGCENIEVDLLKDRINLRQKTGRVNCIEAIGGFSPAGTMISDGFKPAE